MTTFVSALRYTALAVAIIMSVIAALNYVFNHETMAFASAGFATIAIVCAIVGTIAHATCVRLERHINIERFA